MDRIESVGDSEFFKRSEKKKKESKTLKVGGNFPSLIESVKEKGRIKEE